MSREKINYEDPRLSERLILLSKMGFSREALLDIEESNLEGLNVLLYAPEKFITPHTVEALSKLPQKNPKGLKVLQTFTNAAIVLVDKGFTPEALVALAEINPEGLDNLRIFSKSAITLKEKGVVPNRLIKLALDNAGELRDVLSGENPQWVEWAKRMDSPQERAYTRGAADGMLNTVGIPQNVGALVGQYLDREDGAAMAKTCKAALKQASDSRSFWENKIQEEKQQNANNSGKGL